MLKKRGSERAQSALEFMILVGAVILFFISFLFIIQTNLGEKFKENYRVTIRDIAATVQDELNLAHNSADGYSRNFTLPQKIISLEYDIVVVDDTVYLHTAGDEYTISLPVPASFGNITRGVNTITRREGLVCLNTDFLTCKALAGLYKCGDGNIDFNLGEECDDDNNDDDDGCSGTYCLIELGYTCSNSSQTCREHCQDEIDNDGDGKCDTDGDCTPEWLSADSGGLDFIPLVPGSDPGCDSVDDKDEFDYECTDGFDNDADTFCDTLGAVCSDGSTPGDIDCADPDDDDESG